MTSAIPMIRVAGPDDLDAVAALLTEAFLPDPIMSAITAAAPDPQRALTHLHHVKLASHYLSTDETARAGARVDLAVDASDRLLGAACGTPRSPGAVRAASPDRSNRTGRLRRDWTRTFWVAPGTCACSTTPCAKPTGRRPRTGTCP